MAEEENVKGCQVDEKCGIINIIMRIWRINL